MIQHGVELERSNPGEGFKFTNGKDMTDIVLPQYRQGFERLMAQAKKMLYWKLGWEDNDAQALADCFEYLRRRGIAPSLQKLSLHTNKFTDASVGWFVTMIK